jgi:hypothetical protein
LNDRREARARLHEERISSENYTPTNKNVASPVSQRYDPAESGVPLGFFSTLTKARTAEAVSIKPWAVLIFVAAVGSDDEGEASREAAIPRRSNWIEVLKSGRAALSWD